MDIRVHMILEDRTNAIRFSLVLRDTTFKVLLCLTNIESITALALILINKARHAVFECPIFHMEPITNPIQAFVYQT